MVAELVLRTDDGRAIENHARELGVQYLLGHSPSARVRRYSATYDAAKAADAHAGFCPAARLLGS